MLTSGWSSDRQHEKTERQRVGGGGRRGGGETEGEKK